MSGCGPFVSPGADQAHPELAGAPGPGGAAKVRLLTREASLGRPPHTVEDGQWHLDWDVVVSPDGRLLVWHEERGDKECVVVNGVAGRLYDSVDWRSGWDNLFGPEGRHFAYTATRDGHQFAVIDGKEGPPFDTNCYIFFLFSPDGKRVAYTATKGGGEFVILDGAISRMFGAVWGMCFSADSKHFAYAASSGDNQCIVVVDGEESPSYAMVSEGGPWFSPDGKRVACGFMREEGRWFSVVGSKVIGPYNGVDGHTFSADGKRVAFYAWRGERNFIVIDDGVSAIQEYPFEGDWVVGMQFSPDGRRFAYVAGRREGSKERYVAVVDGKAGRGYGGILEWEPPKGPRFVISGPGPLFSFERSERFLFGPNGTHVVYRCDEGWPHDKEFMVIDGKEFGPYDNAWDVNFSADGRRVAFVGWRERKAFLVLDGVETGPFESVHHYEFSPDGGHFACTVLRDNRSFVFLDGPEIPDRLGFWFLPDNRPIYAIGTSEDDWRVVLDGKEYPCAGILMWSADGKRLACVTKSGGGYRVVMDECAGKVYDEIDRLEFTPDGAHLTYFARLGGKWFLVFDDTESGAYDEIVIRQEDCGPPLKPKFDGPSRLWFLARRGDELFRVEAEVVPEK
jgi:Tol biopolymer transport system component